MIKSAGILKITLKAWEKNLKQAPGDPSIRSALLDLKRKLKIVVLAKKRRYKKHILQDLTTHNRNKNQKDFWKTLKKIFAKNKTNPIQPSSADFVEHFKETFHSKRPQDIPPKSNEKGPLDYIISIKELEDASSKLKSGKS